MSALMMLHIAAETDEELRTRSANEAVEFCRQSAQEMHNVH